MSGPGSFGQVQILGKFVGLFTVRVKTMLRRLRNCAGFGCRDVTHLRANVT